MILWFVVYICFCLFYEAYYQVIPKFESLILNDLDKVGHFNLDKFKIEYVKVNIR